MPFQYRLGEATDDDRLEVDGFFKAMQRQNTLKLFNQYVAGLHIGQRQLLQGT